MTWESALTRLVPDLVAIYGTHLDRVVLFGSVARGTQTEESDIDIALFLRPGVTAEMEDQATALAAELGLACNRVLSVVSIDSDRFAEWKDVLPFYQNVQKDGVVLWQAA